MFLIYPTLILTCIHQAVLTWLGVGGIADGDASDDDLNTCLQPPPGLAAERASLPNHYLPPQMGLWQPTELENGLPAYIARALAHQVHARLRTHSPPVDCRERVCLPASSRVQEWDAVSVCACLRLKQ